MEPGAKRRRDELDLDGHTTTKEPSVISAAQRARTSGGEGGKYRGQGDQKLGGRTHHRYCEKGKKNGNQPTPRKRNRPPGKKASDKDTEWWRVRQGFKKNVKPDQYILLYVRRGQEEKSQWWGGGPVCTTGKRDRAHLSRSESDEKLPLKGRNCIGEEGGGKAGIREW